MNKPPFPDGHTISPPVLQHLCRNERMRVAFQEAILAYQQGEVPVGAAIFRDGKLICSAHNQMHQTNDPTAHAERLVLDSARIKLRQRLLTGCELYVTLEPCAMCAGAIWLSRPKCLYFGAYDAKCGAAGGKSDLFAQQLFEFPIEVYGGIDEPACQELIQAFFRDIRKKGS